MESATSDYRLTGDVVVVRDPTHGRSVVNAAVSQPSAADEQALGKLFFVFEIESRPANAEEIFLEVQNAITSTYYRNQTGDSELNFEKALQEGNLALRQYLTQRHGNLLSSFHAVIAIINGSDIHLAAAGRIHAFLVRGSRILDVLESHEPTAFNPVRIFSHLISGHLQLGDRVLFCTTSILDYVSEEKLRQTISGVTTAHSSFALEAMLKESAASHTFAAVIAGLTGTPIKQAPVVRPAGQQPLEAQASMDELQAKSRTTTELLTPSLWPKAKNLVATVRHALGAAIRTRLFGRPARRRLPPTEIITRQPHLTVGDRRQRWKMTLQQTGRLIAGGLATIGLAVINLFRRRRTVGASLRQLPGQTNERISQSVRSWQRLSVGQKRLLIGALVLLFVFAISIVWRGTGQEARLSEEEKAGLAGQIDQKIFQAQAALTYSDESSAITLLNEASGLVEEYPNRRTADKEQRSFWLSRISTEREKTKHIIKLDNPTVFADLAQTGLSAPLPELVRVGTTIYGSTNERLFIISAKDSVESRELPVHTGAVSQLASIGQNLVVLLTDAGEMIEYNIGQDSFATVTVPFNNQDRLIIDMATYESRVYFLDIKNNQIYKHSRGSVNYSSGQAWLTDRSVAIAEAQGLAVDGNIFLVSKTGSVSQLFQGERQVDFSLDQIEPALEHAGAMWTDTQSNFLYLTDPVGKRLVVFTKTGSLKDQYVSDHFERAQGLAVNQSGTNAYLLIGTAIYEVPLNQ